MRFPWKTYETEVRTFDPNKNMEWYVDRMKEKMVRSRYWLTEAFNDGVFGRKPDPRNPYYWEDEEEDV